MPACCVAFGQQCCKGEVCTCFCSFAFGVQESKMFTVNTSEEGLGNHDGHIIAVALNNNTWS